MHAISGVLALSAPGPRTHRVIQPSAGPCLLVHYARALAELPWSLPLIQAAADVGDDHDDHEIDDGCSLRFTPAAPFSQEMLVLARVLMVQFQRNVDDREALCHMAIEMSACASLHDLVQQLSPSVLGWFRALVAAAAAACDPAVEEPDYWVISGARCSRT